MIAVLAGSKMQFDDFLRPWINYADMNKFRYVSELKHIRGTLFTECVRIGTFYNNPMYPEIYEQVTRIISLRNCK